MKKTGLTCLLEWMYNFNNEKGFMPTPTEIRARAKEMKSIDEICVRGAYLDGAQSVVDVRAGFPIVSPQDYYNKNYVS